MASTITGEAPPPYASSEPISSTSPPAYTSLTSPRQAPTSPRAPSPKLITARESCTVTCPRCNTTDSTLVVLSNEPVVAPSSNSRALKGVTWKGKWANHKCKRCNHVLASVPPGPQKASRRTANGGAATANVAGTVASFIAAVLM
eukprot:comp21935_c0_seq1/m.31580 comp21935_c0_seq1/g.31580  ORF comp21935_c0_seq1/g.31580 comp21935_c0_seq1/m.31580 type:complete len:145 (-) comp21935_c0_seq1:340-774(-)